MRQYLICRLRPKSHRDQLKRALSIPVLCVLITRVRKTDGLTDKVIRWGYHCPTPSFPSLFSQLFLFCLYFRPLCFSTGCSWMNGPSQRSNPRADNRWHGWIFPYPLDAMPLFVLQVAPVDECGGHVKDLPFLLLPLCPPQGFLSHCLSLSVLHVLSPSFSVLTQESSLLSGDSMYGMKCHPPPTWRFN